VQARGLGGAKRTPLCTIYSRLLENAPVQTGLSFPSKLVQRQNLRLRTSIVLRYTETLSICWAQLRNWLCGHWFSWRARHGVSLPLIFGCSWMPLSYEATFFFNRTPLPGRHVPSSQHVGKLVLSLKLLKVCQKLPDPDQSACLSGVLESRPTKTSRL